MSWFELADNAIGAAVRIEEIKRNAGASSGSQQQTIGQPQVPQVVPKQVGTEAKPHNDNKLLLVAGGGAVLLIGVILLMRK